MEESRICALAKLYEQLNANGFEWVDTPLLNKEDAYVSKAEDGTGYILKKWFQGRECDVRRENELIAGAENLARIHQRTQKGSGICLQKKCEKPV